MFLFVPPTVDWVTSCDLTVNKSLALTIIVARHSCSARCCSKSFSLRTPCSTRARRRLVRPPPDDLAFHRPHTSNNDGAKHVARLRAFICIHHDNELEQANTHKSAQTHAGSVFWVTRNLDLWPQNKCVFRTHGGITLSNARLKSMQSNDWKVKLSGKINYGTVSQEHTRTGNHK